MAERELLFSVTKEDCRWDYFRCPGKGGQKVNKTSSGVRCTHKASGAVGQSCDERSQHINKRLAFERMVETKEFKQWHRMEVARRTGQLERAEDKVAKEMCNIKVEIQQNGKWTEVDKDDPLSDVE